MIRYSMSSLKKLHKGVVLVVILFTFVLASTISSITRAATTPSLGAAASYGILASTYTNTSASTVNGDVGFTTGPAVAPGGVHNNYGSGAPYTTAGTDQGAALSNLNAQTCDFNLGIAVDLSSLTQPLAPGVYCSTGAMSISTTLTLSGGGTYIFRADGALNTAASSSITLAGGASACDIFWTPTGATTLGANTTFAGTVIGDAGITVGANTTWTGRALAFGGTVTTDTSTITVPTCAPGILRVVKQVVNNNGGSAVASDFNVHVKNSGTDVSGSPAAGAGSPGTSYSLPAGTYNVSEDTNAQYNASFSGDCDASGNVTLALGEDKTCTITNDDRTASINVVKTVVNDNGQTKVVDDFPLFVDGSPVTAGDTNVFAPGTHTVTEAFDPDYTPTFSGDCDENGNISLVPGDNKFCIVINDDNGGFGVFGLPAEPPLIEVVKVPNPFNLPSGPGSVTYTFTVGNLGTETITDITMNDDSCSPLALISGDTNANAALEADETWTYTCTTNVPQTHTNNAVVTGFANGVTATDIASATVVVNAAPVPPLIHVTKIPDPLSMVFGGGAVTYTESITNPGTVPLSNITLTDDTCSQLTFISGDTNSDTNLDPSETWVYTCTTNVSSTTTNTAIATGMASGMTARDFAIATVVVGGVPGLPNTGSNAKN